MARLFLFFLLFCISHETYADSLKGLITHKSDTCAPVSRYQITISKEIYGLKLEEASQVSGNQQETLSALLKKLDISFVLKTLNSQVIQENVELGSPEYWRMSTRMVMELTSQSDVQKAFITLNKEGYKTNMSTTTRTPSACR